ncbi:MAG: sigma-70 family RNA polymerase sigma factor [Clostridia bacterium]|nr:sigma-70 family RNA polymerase sigma factor [Clostridia bacterium]
MEDTAIIQLFFQRAEQAIVEVQQKYGSFCRTVAMNLLQQKEDAEECVNDTWQAAWQRIPPENPRMLGAFLGRITRNLAISRFRKNTAQMRSEGLTVLLSELEHCVPSGQSTEEAVDSILLGEYISKWLESLSDDDRALFLRRYWFGESLRELAREVGTGEGHLAQKLYRLRLQLKKALEKEGVVV